MQKVLLDKKFFNIYQTLECGQMFRFKKIGSNDYEVYSLDKQCRVTETQDGVRLESTDTDYFLQYFDADTDYEKICRELSQFAELKQAIEYGRGIRICNQDAFETTVSFILSANNNIPRIKSIIERLCKSYGKDMQGWYAFPLPSVLNSLDKEQFRAQGCGFRDVYLRDSIKVIADKAYFDRFSDLDAEASAKELMLLKGVGRKVADCIALFALKKRDVYPVDTWIFNAHKTPQLNTPEKVRAHYLNRYGSLAGYAQQYLFFYNREKVFSGGVNVAG